MPDKVPWICFSRSAPTLLSLEIWTRATFWCLKKDRYFHLSIFFILFRCSIVLLSRGEKAFRRIEALHIQTRPQIDGDFTFLHSIQNILVVFSFNSSSSTIFKPSTVNQRGPCRDIVCWRWWWLGEGQGFFPVSPLERHFSHLSLVDAANLLFRFVCWLLFCCI